MGAAKRKRQTHIIEKFKAWHQGTGPALSPAEIKEMENFREGPPAGAVSTIDELAAMLKVQPRTVDFWIRAGMPKAPQGWYVVSEVQEWRKKRLENQRPRGRSVEADERLKEARASREEILLAQLRAGLISREEVDRRDVAKIMALKRHLQALPRTAAPVVSGMEPREAEAWLEEYLRRCIESFARDTIAKEEPTEPRAAAG